MLCSSFFCLQKFTVQRFTSRVLFDCIIFEEMDIVTIHSTGVLWREGRLLERRHKFAVLYILDDLQQPCVAAEEASSPPSDSCIPCPPIDETAQAGHTGVDRRVAVQQLSVVDIQPSVKLQMGARFRIRMPGRKKNITRMSKSDIRCEPL